MIYNEFEEFAEQNQEEYKKLLKKLISMPSPSFKEEKIAELIEKFLVKHAENYTVSSVKIYQDEIHNVYCEIGKGEECDLKKVPIRVFTAHIDTVFADEEEIPVREEGDCLYGLGAKDNCANVCALMYCAKYIFEGQIIPGQNLLFVFDVCEEGTGNLHGCKRIFEKYKKIKELIAFDLDNMVIYNRGVGSVRYKVSIKTKGGHSFQDFGSENAIALMAECIHKFYETDVSVFSGKTTFNVGRIEGGTTVNAIAEGCEALFEWRAEYDDTLKKMEGIFFRLIEDMKRDNVMVKTELIGIRPSNQVFSEEAAERQRHLEEKMYQLVTDISGETPRFSAGSTDCNIPLSMGIPAVCIGTCRGCGEHTREEYVEISSLKQGLTIALAAVLS